MIVVLSYIFAFIVTMILACIMYPIAAIFFVFGKIGFFVDLISRKVFSAVNRAIKYLWADLANSKFINHSESDKKYIDNNTN